MSMTQDLANRLAPHTVRRLAVACMAAGVAVDLVTVRQVRLHATLLQARSSVWRRLDRPGGALVTAGLTLLRSSAQPSRPN